MTTTLSANDPDPTRIRRVLQAAELHYLQGIQQKEIAKRLHVSEATVSRMLQFARDNELVTLKLHPPRNEILSGKLRAKYADLGIREAIVSGYERIHVAYAAAQYFQSHCADGDTVVLDGGVTIRDFVRALSRNDMKSKLNIGPICADPASYENSSAELITRLSEKSDSCHVVKAPSFYGNDFLNSVRNSVSQICRKARFVLLGVGPWQAEFTAFEFTKHLGYTPDSEVSFQNVVAVSGYCPLNRFGGLELAAQSLLDERMPRVLTFDDLSVLAASHHTISILMAGGTEKTAAVRTVLAAKMANTLIVDEGLAETLLKE